MLKTLRLDAGLPQDVERAAAILRAGGTVAFPTETVYGLGANALDAAAVVKIFEAKQRPAWDPLIVHLAAADALDTVAEVPAQLQAVVGELTGAFWPGPLTLLLPRTRAVPNAVTSGRELVGVRVPALASARELLRLAGVPIAAPSANRFGHTSPTTAEHVLDDLDGRIGAVLDGGPCVIGVESTVLDPATMTIYRPGGVTAERIAEVTGMSPQRYEPDEVAKAESLPSPGVGIRHYAPLARLVLVPGDRDSVIRCGQLFPGERVGLMLPEDWAEDGEPMTVYRWGRWSDAASLAAGLFSGLRALDAAGVSVIVCPLPPDEGLRSALRDRLQKAARSV